MGLLSKFEGLSLAARTGVVAGSMVIGFSVIVSGVALAAVSATQAVFPQAAAPGASATEEGDGLAARAGNVDKDPATPSPVAAGSATKTSAQKSKRNAASGRGTFTPGKTAKNGESVE